MSSSSSSYSDEDTEASAPGVTAPPSASQLGQVVELAQICSFCATFRKPLRLPSFSRSELQDALLGASNGDRTHVELLAELHFKLAREHPTAKMEKMVQDWEKTLARKLQENWRKEFTANPMGGGVLYRDLTVFERVKILDALCHWKLDTCAEIHKHIATLQKENDNDGIRKLRAGEIGTDDKGVSYWYFDDGCWIYAEDKPRWQREERKPSYLVEFASAKRIRLSINFDPDNNSSAPPVRLPVKAYEVHEEVKEEKKVKMEGASEIVKQESKLKDEVSTSESTKNEGREAVKAEQQDATAVISKASSDETLANVKEEASTISAGGMDSDILCAVGSHSTGTEKRGEQAVTPSQTNGTAQVKDAATDRSIVEVDTSLKLDEVSSAASHKGHSEATTTNTEDTTTSTEVNEDNSVDHSHASVVAIVGSKKRTIIDDDSSDSSNDTDATKAAARKDVNHEVSSSPPRKKRKASVEHSNSEVSVNDETSKNDVIKSDNTAANGIAASAEVEPAVAVAKETGPASKPEKRNEGGVVDDVQASKTDVEKTVDTAKPLGLAATSPTDPAAAPESFDITCESCKKCYDMRYVDPPLVERPTDEWRCFECLVNDARGWPRRRKSKPRESFSPQANGRGGEGSSKKRSSSSKSRTGSSSSKRTKKSSRKSSSSKTKSSRSSSSKRKSSSSKSSSSKKSSSSSKKHKKRKSSSSSHHRHSSSHSHHRRRHHSHYHHEEFAKLVGLFRDRQEHRLGIEEARIKGDLQVACDEAPQGWRVVSSTLDDLRALIETLSGGSLEQDRLRGRLILILKDQEKLDEQRRKQQELAWNILPRRQSSRIAIGRMRQSAQDSDAEEGVSDDDVESRRPGLRSSRSHSTASDFDDKQKLAYDRASRARRRHQDSDDEMDMDDEDDEVDGNAPTPGNWIDWSLLKGNTRRLSTVCLALVNRLLKEEAADLFSRPVNPELDGCPNYLSVINHPMDLGTIRSRLESNSYRKWEIFKKDVELVWQNCRTFNAPDTMVVQFADLLSRLSRSMCVAAEKKGVSHMKDIANGDGNSADEDGNFSDASKAGSRSSVNKAWTESSASESSESSDGDSSSGGDSGSDSRKRRPTRSSSKKPQTRSRSTRSSRTRSPAKSRSSRSTRSRSSKKRPAPSSSSEDESSASEDEVISSVRKSRRQPRSSSSKASAKVDPPTEDDSSGDESASNRPPPPQNGAPSPSPPPPPPPQALVQKRSKPRLIISDSSSSDDSSDSNSSSSSSSDSDDSDSDVPATSKPPQPPSPSSAEVPAPPPPSPPPPAASPVDSKPRSSPKVNTKPKTSASHGRKAKAPSAAKTDAGGSGYAHSGPLLNTYLSPSSSSSSDLSSGSSDSSDGDSDDSD